MKLEFLATLDAILKKGSFAGAAEEVGVTTSAVSLKIKRLEEYLGQPLFDRSSRTARPNALARELASSMRSGLLLMEAARAKSTPTVSGRVVVGTIRTLQSTIVPRALSHIASRHAQLAVKVVPGSSPELLSGLKAGSLDAAVVIRPTGGGSSRLRWYEFERQVFVLVAPPDAHGATPSELIAKYPWIQFDTSLTGGRLAASYLRRISPRKPVTFELGSIDAIVAMVSAGLGVSVIPKYSGFAWPVREVGLGRNAPTRQIAFVCRAIDRDNRRLLALQDAFATSFEDGYVGARRPTSVASTGRSIGTRRLQER